MDRQIQTDRLIDKQTESHAHTTLLIRCLAVTWSGTVHIHFRRFLLRCGILPGAKFTLRPIKVLRSRILAALLHGTPAAGVSQTWWC